MIRKFIFVGIPFVLLLSSCVLDGSLKKVEPYYLFNDNNSKVWMVEHCYKDGKDYAPLSDKYKQIITFHKSLNCYMQPMNTFGDETGRSGSFFLDRKNKRFEIYFDDETWEFEIEMMTHDRIVLKGDKDFKYSLDLIPVPEP